MAACGRFLGDPARHSVQSFDNLPRRPEASQLRWSRHLDGRHHLPQIRQLETWCMIEGLRVSLSLSLCGGKWPQHRHQFVTETGSDVNSPPQGRGLEQFTAMCRRVWPGAVKCEAEVGPREPVAMAATCRRRSRFKHGCQWISALSAKAGGTHRSENQAASGRDHVAEAMILGT